MKSSLMALALAAGTVSAAQAQELSGRVVDLDTEGPVAGATITLVSLNRGRVASATTDQQGRFRLVADRAGMFRAEVRRVGSLPVIDGPFDLAAHQVIETVYRIKLVPLTLEDLDVVAEKEAAQRFLTEAGFYERQRSDFGKFIDRETIEARRARQFTDLLATVAGVRLTPFSSGFDRASVRLRGSSLSTGGACHPKVYLDGLLVVQGDARPFSRVLRQDPNGVATEVQAEEFERTEVDINDVVMPNDIEALEIYRSGAQVPAKFGGTSTATQCGVIVIWSRRGGRPQR